MINKTFNLVLISAALTACQTSQEFQAASRKGLSNSFSCAQINSAFTAYNADKSSLDALLQVGKTTQMDTSKVTTKTADRYYEDAKQSANLALILQGCPPLT